MKKRRKGKKEKSETLNPNSLLKIYKRFGSHYKKYGRVLAVAYACLFVGIGLSVLSPWPLKLILDHVILKAPLPAEVDFLSPLFSLDAKLLLLVLSLSILAMAILEAIFSYINKYWISSTGDRINADIRERLFAHIQRLSLSFHGTSRAGNLIYLLTSDVKEMKTILIDFPQDFVNRIVTFGSYLFLMLALDWRLGLIGLGTVPPMFLLTRYFSRRMKNAIRKRRKKEGDIASLVVENVTSMALVQAYGKEEEEKARFSKENEESQEASLQALRLHRMYSRLSETVVTLGTAGVLYVGGRLALGEAILPGTLVLFVAYLKDILGSFEKFSGLFIELAKAGVSGERLLEVLENEMITEDAPDAVAAPPFRGRIEFRNVNFAYQQGHEVLKNLSFVVEPGETVALVGHSGAGKSTLVSLLMRFYDPQAGQIFVDGQDIRRFTLKSYRDQIMILLQEAMLFRQSVRDNLSFGKDGATDEEIVEAAEMAEAHEFISEMPDGYDTLVAEGGKNLSGGQKQRLNIARAFMRNAPILILDEPATGLDARAEAKINIAIHRLTRDKVAFIIAHKLATVAGADKILMLEHGRLVGFGEHPQLMRDCAPYREIYDLQFAWQKVMRPIEAAASDDNGHSGVAQPVESSDE